MDHQTSTGREGNFWNYDFKCPSCGVEGKMGVPDDQRGPINCPEDCGASFIQWKDKGTAKLTCVVRPFRAVEE